MATAWREKQNLALRGDSDMNCKPIYQVRNGQAKSESIEYTALT